VAKIVIDSESIGAEELAELDILSQNSIPNRHEIISMHNGTFGNAVNATRDQVYKLASVMSSTTQIATIIGVDKNTINKYFSREIKMARAFAKQKLITRFFHLALHGNNPVDRLFALKNWAGLSDNGAIEDYDDPEEGVDFKIRRPAKTIQSVYDLDERNRGRTEIEFKHEET
jgi:hypothetical protein